MKDNFYVMIYSHIRYQLPEVRTSWGELLNLFSHLLVISYIEINIIITSTIMIDATENTRRRFQKIVERDCEQVKILKS